MSKHTPGPWTWHPTGLVRETMASVSVIGCHNHTPYVSHADAQLICAAPEMLDRLQLALQYGVDAPGMREAIQKTIAKATSDERKKDG